MIKNVLLFFVAFFIAAASFGQFNYQAANAVKAAGTYTDLGTNGTAITTNFRGVPITYDDDTSAVQNIGFTFTYNGTAFTQFLLCTNGFIKLGTTPPAAIYDVLAGNEANTIYPYNYDLTGGTSPEYRVYTTGSAGSRICTIQYKNVRDYSTTTGQYTGMNFQIRLYETSNTIEFVYGTFTASAAASAILGTNCGIEGTTSSSSVNTTKASSTAWASATFLDGPYTANLLNNRNSVLPTSGQIYRFVAVALPANDAAVSAVYALGKIPSGFGSPQTVQAAIKNAGSAALTNLSVTLAVTGSNSYTNVQTIASLAPGATSIVTFTPFSATLVGTNTLTVTVPADAVTTNNSGTYSQSITAATIGTSNTATATLGVGLNGVTGQFAVKFINPSSKTIDQLSLYFPTTSTGQPYTVSINDASGTGGTPGTTPLWTSPAQTSAGANINIPVSPNLVVPSDFFVVFNQTGTTNLGIGYETENPIRTATFYLNTGTGWSDFSPSNSFKIMVDARFSGGLPISLTNFTGNKEANGNVLNWTTSTEINNKGFALQRSSNGIDYKDLSFIASKANNGNSVITLNYQFVDVNPSIGVNYYRLKQKDINGNENISKTVVLKSFIKNIGIGTVYPNPAKEQLTVLVSSDQAEKISLLVFDMAGKQMIDQKFEIGTNPINIKLNISALTAGNYIVKLVSGDNSVVDSKTFSKQ